MDLPKVGTVWKHKTMKYEHITIVYPSTSQCSRKTITYKYHRTGHIGGCNTAEWFYSEWDPLYQ